MSRGWFAQDREWSTTDAEAMDQSKFKLFKCDPIDVPEIPPNRQHWRISTDVDEIWAVIAARRRAKEG
jgi:hypothetical protein